MSFILSGSAFASFHGGAGALTLEEAVAVALDSNPDITQAVANREAIEFELRQARALYLPRVDLQGSTGYQELNNPSRRLAGIDGRGLEPRDVGVSANWTLFDGFGREAEIERQASRVDGASFRVFERSELLAFAVAREYFEILLQERILKIAQENLAFHQGISNRISEGASGGSLTAADDQQASERLKAAEARITQVREDLEQARIRFFREVAQSPSGLAPYRRMSGSVPSSLEQALATARTNNPQIKIVEADLDAAYAAVKGARSRYMPTVGVEGSARTGEDLDGIDNRTDDVQVRVVGKWNIFAGGADKANEQEQIRRVNEERARLHGAVRDAEEAVKSAWDSRKRQGQVLETLTDQTRFGREVVGSYEDQFIAGKRTLLDLLSAQNTYFNVRILKETAQFSRDLAEYRILASTGQLVASLGGNLPLEADAYARSQARVPETPATEDMRQYSPDRGRGYGVHTGWEATISSK